MLDATTIQALAAFLAVIVAAIGLLTGFIFWHIRDLKTEVRRLDDKIDRSNTEFREGLRQLEERMLRSNQELREEMLRSNQELREEIRRGFAQVLTAMNGHTHDSDTGAATFREMPAADDD